MGNKGIASMNIRLSKIENYNSYVITNTYMSNIRLATQLENLIE